ncbi:hypothetical protein BD560DRAFT_492344 [Blakeslea trispora]|nr:hypothetical protein BD560DRAFT_492344 [Blakeslea trispora]
MQIRKVILNLNWLLTLRTANVYDKLTCVHVEFRSLLSFSAVLEDVVYFWYYAPFCVSRCWNNGDIYDVASIVAVSELFPFSVDVPYLILFYFIVLILTFLTLRVPFIVSSEVEECINCYLYSLLLRYIWFLSGFIQGITLIGRERLTEVINIVLFLLSCLGVVNSFRRFFYLLNSATFYQTDNYPQKPISDFSSICQAALYYQLDLPEDSTTTPNAGPLYSGHPGWTGRPSLSNYQLLILTMKVAVFLADI